MKNVPQIKTILYATDLGEQTRPVFRHAMALAKLYNARIIMLHVVEPMSETAKSVISTYLSAELSEEIQKNAMKSLLQTMKTRLEKYYDDEYSEGKQSALVKEVQVVSGMPSEEILRVAEESHAEMIVMGKSTRKVRGIRVMGSTARRVSRMSQVPVLVVPNYSPSF
jgi:nucleotide-binding universal stress UspA family protein